MAKRAKNPWSSRRRSGIESAEAVVATLACSFPVDLQPIAANRAVQRIEFTPLLTHGGLAVRNDGFIIYVRCDSGQSADLTARFAKDGTGVSLPTAIARRARFTIAHEIAHTFFYDIRRMPPRLKAQVNDGASATKLELACNQIAGLILMPETLMQRDFSKFDFLRAEELRMLANAAMVSAQAVIHRFKHLNKLSHPEAILASVIRDGVDWTISAISRHYSLRNISITAKAGASIRTLVDNPEFVLLGGDRREVHFEFIGHGGKRRLRVSCENERALQRNSSLFLTGTPVAE
jgi:IrrE N-terminal-like domain